MWFIYIIMKQIQLFGCVICMLFITVFSFSQEREIDYLKFHEHFFEALKQKAMQNYNKSIENLEKCYTINPQNTALLFEFSKNYTFQKEYSKAQIFVDKAIKKEPTNRFLLVHKAKISKRQKNYKQATVILEKLADKYPRYYDDLSWLYFKLKDYKNLKKVINTAETKAYSSSRLYYYLQFLQRRLRPASVKKEIKKEDIESLQKAFDANKKYKTLQKLLQKEAEQKKYKLLYKDSKKGLDLFPVQSFVYIMNGIALNKLGKFTEAITILSQGIDFVIDNKELERTFYKQMAIAYFGLKQPKKAKQYQQKAKK